MFHPQHTTKKEESQIWFIWSGESCLYRIILWGLSSNMDFGPGNSPVTSGNSPFLTLYLSCIHVWPWTELVHNNLVEWNFQIEWNSAILVVTKILALICTYSQLVWMYSLVGTNWNGIVVPIQRVTQNMALSFSFTKHIFQNETVVCHARHNWDRRDVYSNHISIR